MLVPKNLGNPYFDTANNGAQEAAKELGVPKSQLYALAHEKPAVEA